MLLLRSVQLALGVQAGEFSKWNKKTAKDFTDRWHTLRQFGCDPWGSWNYFNSL